MTSNCWKLPVHYLDMVGVTGSIPVAPTTQSFQTKILRVES